MDSNAISWKIIDTMFKDNPNMIVKHHIDSYNQFFQLDYVMFLKIIILLDFLKN